MGIWGNNQGTLTIGNFNNSGTIKADNGNGIFLKEMSIWKLLIIVEL